MKSQYPLRIKTSRWVLKIKRVASLKISSKEKTLLILTLFSLSNFLDNRLKISVISNKYNDEKKLAQTSDLLNALQKEIPNKYVQTIY